MNRSTVAIIALGGTLLAGASVGGTALAMGHSAPAATVHAAAPARPAPGKTIIVQRPANAPSVTINNNAPAPQSTTYVPVPAPAPAYNASGLRYVSGTIYANASTSDAFAEAIATAYSGPGTIAVYSPVTGQVYEVTYSIVGAGTVTATTATGVYVQF
jgi:hypothetical protein